MLPKHLQIYYSGLMYDPAEPSGYLYIQPCSYLSNYDYSTLTVDLQLDLIGTSLSCLLNLEYEPFSSSIMSNTNYSVLSDFSVLDTVAYDSFSCSVDLLENTIEHRSFNYNLLVNNPVEIDLYSDDVSSTQNEFLYGSYLGLKELTVTGLPNTIGRAIVSREDVPISEWLLPSNISGWLSCVSLSSITEDRPLEGICFGLLLSCVYKDYELIILQLKEFVNQSRAYNYILQDSNGIWYLNPDTIYGFYPTVNLLSYSSTYDFKELPYNCLLLISLCTAIQTITDARPYLEYTFDGQWGDFKAQLLLCMRAQALFVSNSVSPMSNLCAYKADNSYYAYNILSYSASCYAAVGLSLYLSYDYSSYIHTQAAKLQSCLLDFPTDLTSSIFSNLMERNMELVSLWYERDVQDNHDHNICLSLIAQLWWKAYYNVGSVQATIDQYESLGLNSSLVDSAFGFILSSLQIPLPTYLDSTAATGTVEDRPNFVALSIIEPLDIDSSTDIAEILFGASVAEGNALANNYFDLVSIKCSAFVAATLLELRRMMPFGLKWFDESKVNDISSVIGSMLYAEAELYWTWAAQLDTFSKSVSAFTAVSDDARDWFNNKYNSNVFASDGLLRQLQVIDSTKDITTLPGIANFLSQFFNTNVTYTRPNLPEFCIYKTNAIEDTLDSYSADLQEIDPDTDYLSKDQYLSIVFKKQSGNWVPRQVPGFPIKPSDVDQDIDIVSISDYLLNPVVGVAVIDGPIYIYPLTDYIMQATFILSEVPKFLSTAVDSFISTGLLTQFESTLEFVGEQ